MKIRRSSALLLMLVAGLCRAAPVIHPEFPLQNPQAASLILKASGGEQCGACGNTGDPNDGGYPGPDDGGDPGPDDGSDPNGGTDAS
ncbi:hypothetical protein [Pantoea stewartii]|uniref:hypothetical protein n=1 Tax=Pantoea stewartii TaxID=66269 RepID=UPI0025A02AD3|nr:hypothetical protein [Pantoea stewartii]